MRVGHFESTPLLPHTITYCNRRRNPSGVGDDVMIDHNIHLQVLFQSIVNSHLGHVPSSTCLCMYTRTHRSSSGVRNENTK